MTKKRLNIAQGVARVTLFDAKLRPLAERLVYRNRNNRLRVSIKTHRKAYQPRSKVSITAKTTDAKGNPVAAEEIHVARDIRLAELTGARLHVGHVSAGGSVDLIRRAREAGIQVTAEVTPHHLALTEEMTSGYDTNTKMAPPLRTNKDTLGLRAGLVEGVIDCIAPAHAPHATHEKDVE